MSSLSLPYTAPLRTLEGLGLSRVSVLGHLGVTLTGAGRTGLNICLQKRNLTKLDGKVHLIALCMGKA